MRPDILTVLLRGEHVSEQRRAARFYLRFQLGLPGDLDGWTVAR